MERWEGYEVVFVEFVDMKGGVADLLVRALAHGFVEMIECTHLDCDGQGFRDRGFLAIIALQSYAMVFVPDAVGGYRWVVTAHAISLSLRNCVGLDHRKHLT